MKRIYFILVLSVLPFLSRASAQSTALFAKANAQYARGQYQKALDLYQQVLNEGEHSAILYFNMGNASYKLGEIPSAILYYEKARKLSPGDEDIAANIRFLNAKTTDKMEELPEFFLSRWWRSLVLSFSSGTFAVFSIILMVIGSALLIVYFFAHERIIKKSSFIAAVVFFIYGILTVFILSQQLSYTDNLHEGIVFSSPVYVKSAPSDASRSLYLIHDGVKVSILETSDRWIRVRLANGNEGWIRTADMKEI